LDRVFGAQDAELFSGRRYDDTDLPNADAFVDAVFGFALIAPGKGSGFDRDYVERVEERSAARFAGCCSDTLPDSDRKSAMENVALNSLLGATLG
jgi:hypothetical protein